MVTVEGTCGALVTHSDLEEVDKQRGVRAAHGEVVSRLKGSVQRSRSRVWEGDETSRTQGKSTN